MHKLYELCVPTGQELILYVFGALITLFVVNGQVLWDSLLRGTGTDSSTALLFNQSYKQLVARYTTVSDPQLINAVIWGLTALLGLLFALALASFMRGTRDDMRGLARHDFLEKLVLRVTSLVALVVTLVLAVSVELPTVSRAFVRALTGPFAAWYTLPVMVLAVFGLALTLYLAAVACRLFALRVRVFSSVID